MLIYDRYNITTDRHECYVLLVAVGSEVTAPSPPLHQDNEESIQSEALAISKKFQSIREEVLHQFGYDSVQPEHPDAGRSTQEQFTAQTMMQCEGEFWKLLFLQGWKQGSLRVCVCVCSLGLVDAGVQRCVDWFRLKWAECMEAVLVPTINHILCMSMKFHFLCDVMRGERSHLSPNCPCLHSGCQKASYCLIFLLLFLPVMTPWCREQIPVEGNFGLMFDQLNHSMDLLSREFSTRLAVQVLVLPQSLGHQYVPVCPIQMFLTSDLWDLLQEQRQQSVLAGQDFTQAVQGSLQELASTTETLLYVLKLLLSLTFISIFTQ